jgi:hypothetical protein
MRPFRGGEAGKTYQEAGYFLVKSKKRPGTMERRVAGVEKAKTRRNETFSRRRSRKKTFQEVECFLLKSKKRPGKLRISRIYSF